MLNLIKKGLKKYIKFIQKTLSGIILLIVYFVGLGITKLVMMIFQPKLINFGKFERPNWKKAALYKGEKLFVDPY